jgi:hypothetical protein
MQMRCSVLFTHRKKIAMTQTHVFLPLTAAAKRGDAATCNMCRELLRHVRTCEDRLQTHPTQLTTNSKPDNILKNHIF